MNNSNVEFLENAESSINPSSDPMNNGILPQFKNHMLINMDSSMDGTYEDFEIFKEYENHCIPEKDEVLLP